VNICNRVCAAPVMSLSVTSALTDSGNLPSHTICQSCPELIGLSCANLRAKSATVKSPQSVARLRRR
jgi:hypothetical protein